MKCHDCKNPLSQTTHLCDKYTPGFYIVKPDSSEPGYISQDFKTKRYPDQDTGVKVCPSCMEVRKNKDS